MKEIKTNGIKALFVEVPEDISSLMSIQQNNVLLLWRSDIDYLEIQLPSGQYQILGKSTELSEEQMKEICEYKEIDSYDCDGMVWYDIYRNYALDDSYWLNSCDQFFTVQESYLSLLEANGIVDRNNLANHDTTTILGSSPSGIYYEVLDELRDKWQESQSKVKHYLVLKRI